MKTLIVYYSFTHNNEKLAMYLQKELDCDIAKIETLQKRTGFSIFLDLVFKRKPALKTMPYYLQDYRHVIFIAPIWAGKIAMPMKSFMIDQESSLKQYSFITLCGGAEGQLGKVNMELESTLGIAPRRLLELRINDLLPADQKNKVKHTSGFRVEPDDFGKFDAQLRNFIEEENVVNAT
jgi:flavodoxin